MPQLKMRGIDVNKVCLISNILIDELQALLDCPKSYFTIECINTTYIMDRKVTAGYPFVEVSWFDRGQEIQDKVATIITKYIQNAGYENVDVFFTLLDKKRYYENGEHF